jgi:uncharacterized protein YciI
MKWVMFYELAGDGLVKVPTSFPGHQARMVEFHGAGTLLLMAGPYGNPPVGALGIFTSREAAEAFMAGDPFVLNGVVGKSVLHEWSEALAP